MASSRNAGNGDRKLYVNLKADPTPKEKDCLINILRQLNNKVRFASHTYKSIYPMAEVAPHFYANPKVHKKYVPVRPIISGINSVKCRLAKHLAKLFNPLVGKSKYYIKNSEHLVKLLKEINLEEDDVFVSYDVTALFTVMVGIAVDRAKKDTEWYNRTKFTLEEMGELLTFCLNTTYFKVQCEFYQQVFRAAMGSPYQHSLLRCSWRCLR